MTPNPNLVNYDASGIHTTSAPGCFPGNVAPYGCREMSGNVWEWTRSRDVKYPYDPADGREQIQSSSDWIRLRGGTYWAEVARLRYAARNWLDPNFRFDHYGFRVLASPSTAGL